MRGYPSSFRLLLIVCCVALTFGAVGCKYAAPSIMVGTAHAGEQTTEAVRFDIAVELENANDEPLELSEFVYHVSMDGRLLYSGKRDAGATLAQNSSNELLLPAVVRYSDVGTVNPAEWSIEGYLVYLPPQALADVLFDSGLRRPKARFHGDGTVALPPAP